MTKLFAAIALAVVTQVTSLHAGVFGFLTGKGHSLGNQVSTSAGSRAEAKVDKSGSIVRVGSNTSAKVSDNGTVTLSKGVMLVSSGEGFMRRPPVQISTPQGDVTVRGSAIVAALPDGSVKMTVLEGHAKGMMGDRNMDLNPGQLMIQRHQSRDAVNVDLVALAASSPLLDSRHYQTSLTAEPIIRQEAVAQAQSLGATLTLSGANEGGGSQVVNATELKMAKNGETQSSTGAVTLSGGTFRYSNSNPTVASGTMAVSNAGAVLTLNSASTTGLVNSTALMSNGPSRSGLTISGSNIVYSPGSSTAAVITDSLGNPLPGASSVRYTQALVPEGTVLTPPTNFSSTVSNVGMGSSLQLTRYDYVSASASFLTSSLVLPPGSTQTGALIINGGTVTLSTAPVVTSGGTTSTLVKSGTGNLILGGTGQVASGTVTLGNSATYLGNTVLNSGSLVLRDGAAQQFLNGNMTITGPGGVVLTPTNDGGVLTFQAPGTSTPPAGSGGN